MNPDAKLLCGCSYHFRCITTQANRGGDPRYSGVCDRCNRSSEVIYIFYSETYPSVMLNFTAMHQYGPPWSSERWSSVTDLFYPAQANTPPAVENCAICLEEIGLEKRNILCAAIVGCGHLYHLNCLAEVAVHSTDGNRAATCPLCRNTCNAVYTHSTILGQARWGGPDLESYFQFAITGSSN